MRCENIALDSVQPYVTADKEVPHQDVTPFFRHEIGIVRHHSHESPLRITARVKDVAELRQGSCYFGTLSRDGSGDDEKMNQRDKKRNLCRGVNMSAQAFIEN